MRGFDLFSNVHNLPLKKSTPDQVDGCRNYTVEFNFFFQLTKIYRSDDELVSILNNFRTCTPTLEDIKKINSRMVGPQNKIPEESTIIVPYNKMRVSINTQ